MIASSGVYLGFEPQSGKNKVKNWYLFSSLKHSTKEKEQRLGNWDKVSELSAISTRRLLFK